MNIRDIGGSERAGQITSQAGRPREKPDSESVGRLERALKEPREKEPEKRREPSGREAGPLSGAAILRGLEGPATGGTLPGSADLEGRLEALSEIADRLLVSEPGSADKEIRILVKDSVLPGTEVRLSLQDGKMGVSFVCQSDQSALFLEQHRADLERRLEDRLGGPAKVLVQRETSEQGDGRSRGQRDLYAEWSKRED